MPKLISRRFPGSLEAKVVKFKQYFIVLANFGGSGGSEIKEKLEKIRPRSHQCLKRLLESILDGFWEDFGGQVGGKIALKLDENLIKNFDWKKDRQNEAR